MLVTPYDAKKLAHSTSHNQEHSTDNSATYEQFKAAYAATVLDFYKKHTKTRRRSQSAYIRQVNFFLQLLYSFIAFGL